MQTQFLAIGSDGGRLVVWGTGGTAEDATDDVLNWCDDVVPVTTTIEVPRADAVAFEIDVRRRSDLVVGKASRNGQITITCPTTGSTCVVSV